MKNNSPIDEISVEIAVDVYKNQDNCHTLNCSRCHIPCYIGIKDEDLKELARQFLITCNKNRCKLEKGELR